MKDAGQAPGILIMAEITKIKIKAVQAGVVRADVQEAVRKRMESLI